MAGILSIKEELLDYTVTELSSSHLVLKELVAALSDGHALDPFLEAEAPLALEDLRQVIQILEALTRHELTGCQVESAEPQT
ncbi:MAG: hypothetical protein AAFQ85_13320 [Pseudomonadota bacterium]